jgi:hypothetical protein
MHVCMYVCMYVRMYVCTYVCIDAIHVCVYVRAYVRMYACIDDINIYMYACIDAMHVCIYVCTCPLMLCINICTYILMLCMHIRNCTYVRVYLRICKRVTVSPRMIVHARMVHTYRNHNPHTNFRPKQAHLYNKQAKISTWHASNTRIFLNAP